MDARAPGDTTASCTFWFMSADFVRKYPDKKMPFFQELKAKHGHELSEMKMTYAEVVNGTHVEETLSISHLPWSARATCNSPRSASSMATPPTATLMADMLCLRGS